MPSKGASFRIDADVSPYEEAMQRAIQATSETASAIKEHFEGVNSTFESMKGIFEAAVLALGGGEIASKLNEIAERAAGMRESAEIFNLSTSALQGLQVIAESTGLSSDRLQRMMATLEQKMRTAGEEGGKAAEKFNQLGITTEQLRDPTFTVQDAMEKLGASTNSNAELLSVLGARGAAAIPMLRELANNHNAVAEAAARVGALTTEETGALTAYHGQVEIASEAWDNFRSRIAVGVIPVMETLLGQLTGFASNAQNAADSVNVLKAVADALGTVFIRVVMAGRMIVDVFVGMFKIGVDVFQTLSATVDAFVMGPLLSMSRAMSDLASGHYSKIGSDLVSGIKDAAAGVAVSALKIKADFGDMVNYIGNDAKEASQKILDMQNALADGSAVQAPKVPAASQSLLPDMSRDAQKLQNVMDHIWDEIARGADEKMKQAWAQIAASAAQSDKTQEDAQVGSIDRQIAAVGELGRTHQISSQKELTEENALLNQKWAAQEAYYAKVKTLYANNVDKLAELNTQEAAAYQKHLDDMQKAQDRATTAMQQQWQKIGNTIASGFSSAIDGMITKNRTFSQSVLQMGQSLVTGLINNFVKMGVAWAEQEIMKMIASRTAAAGVVSASAGAAGAAGTASFAAAPWPVDLGAAAFGASMAAVAGSFAVAEHGYDIPAGINPKVQAHAKEMILPANIAEGVRDMASGGGGGGAHLHVHTNDSKSFESQLRNQGSAIHRALKAHLGRGGR